MGIDLVLGSKAGSRFMVPGISLLKEITQLEKIGFNSYDILRSATYNPHKYFNSFQEYGSIEENKKANLVILNSNPIENTKNLRDINGIVFHGRLISSKLRSYILDFMSYL